MSADLRLKDNRSSIYKELLDRANRDEDSMKRINTVGETWVYVVDIETKAQSSQWTDKGSTRLKKAE